MRNIIIKSCVKYTTSDRCNLELQNLKTVFLGARNQKPSQLCLHPNLINLPVGLTHYKNYYIKNGLRIHCIAKNLATYITNDRYSESLSSFLNVIVAFLESTLSLKAKNSTLFSFTRCLTSLGRLSLSRAIRIGIARLGIGNGISFILCTFSCINMVHLEELHERK